jgi:hypothetical protein
MTFPGEMSDKTPCALSYDFYQEKLPCKPLRGRFMRNIFFLEAFLQEKIPVIPLLGAQGAGRRNQEDTPKTRRPFSTWEGVSPRVGAPPDAGRRSATACRFPTARRASPPQSGEIEPGRGDAGRVVSAGASLPPFRARGGWGAQRERGPGQGAWPRAAQACGSRWRACPGAAPPPAPGEGRAVARRRGHGKRGTPGTGRNGGGAGTPSRGGGVLFYAAPWRTGPARR